MNIQKILFAGLLSFMGLAVTVQAGRADEMQDIKSKDVLVVGVKTDYPPFGYLSPSGQNIGIEPEFAADIAKRLGVKIQYVPVRASNRISFCGKARLTC